MPITKVRVKKSYACFDEVFKVGDELVIEPILYEKDTQIVRAWYMKHEGQMVKVADAVIATKGSYKDARITMADGRVFPASLIRPRKFEDLFEKI